MTFSREFVLGRKDATSICRKAKQTHLKAESLSSQPRKKANGNQKRYMKAHRAPNLLAAEFPKTRALGIVQLATKAYGVKSKFKPGSKPPTYWRLSNWWRARVWWFRPGAPIYSQLRCQMKPPVKGSPITWVLKQSGSLPTCVKDYSPSGFPFKHGPTKKRSKPCTMRSKSGGHHHAPLLLRAVHSPQLGDDLFARRVKPHWLLHVGALGVSRFVFVLLFFSFVGHV